MSISTINVIMGRINSASEQSPLSVFKPREFEAGMLDACFSNTARAAAKEIEEADLFIGRFSRNDARKGKGAALHNRLASHAIRFRL